MESWNHSTDSWWLPAGALISAVSIRRHNWRRDRAGRRADRGQKARSASLDSALLPAYIHGRATSPWAQEVAMASQVGSGAGLSIFGAGVSKARRREMIAGYLFLLPWAIGFALFVAGPLLASAALSFTAFDVARPPRFVGLDNYVNAFTTDDRFVNSLKLTFVYAIVSVPLALFGSLLLAILLNQRLRGTSLYRTFFFLPSLTPAVAVAILWTWLLQPDVGLFNYVLSLVGISGPRWLGSTECAMPSLIMIALWTGIGGNRMMIFLAGLQGVPQELYDAADMDGAGALQRFRHITLPMISPTMFFNLVLGIIAALKVF